MSLEMMAALGAQAGEGESFFSWLTAGPLGWSAWTGEERRSKTNHCAINYCSRCIVRKGNGRRWYSRDQWRDPRRVLCRVHNLPLVRAVSAPQRLSTPRLERDMKLQLRCMSNWIEEWISSSPSTIAGRLMFPPDSLQDQILLALTEREGAAQLLALAQWRLWLEGWPLPSGPQAMHFHQLGLMPSQTDRLAVVATTWKVWCCLTGVENSTWSALPIGCDAIYSLKSKLQKNWPDTVVRLPSVLVSDARRCH
jgi:hypothetical protein